MTLAMAGFAFEDAIIKQLSFDMPISQILVLTGGAGAAVFGCLALSQGQSLFAAQLANQRFVLRNLGEMVAAIFFVSALVYGSLSAASAIIQAVPLIVALGGALFLGQSVSLRQWLFIGIGFAGVMMIIQPGTDGFNPATLLAVMTAFALAMRDILTRSLSDSINPLTTSFWAFLSLHIAGWICWPLFGAFTAISLLQWGLIAASTIAAAGAYFLLVLATRTGDVAAIAPYRYSRIVFAFALAAVWFDEPITWPVVVGAVLIILPGLSSGVERLRRA